MAMGLAGFNPMVGIAGNSGVYLIANCSDSLKDKDKDLDNYGIQYDIAKSIFEKNNGVINIDNNGYLNIKPRNIFTNETKSIYYINEKDTNDKYNRLLESINNKKIYPKTYLYTLFTNNTFLFEMQLDYDTKLKKINMKSIINKIKTEKYNLINESSKLKDYSIEKSDIELPLITDIEIKQANSIIKNSKDDMNYIEILEDPNGYFGKNKKNNKRTLSCKNITDIDLESIW